MKLDIYPIGYTFPGTTVYNDGKGDISVAEIAYDFVANDASVQKMNHDLIFAESLVVKSGAITLVLNTDYELGNTIQTYTDYCTAVYGATRTVIDGVKIINPTYQTVTLTATGIYCGDRISAREWNGIEATPVTTTDPIDLDELPDGTHYFFKTDTGITNITGTVKNEINGRTVADWQLQGQFTEIKLRVIGNDVWAVGDTIVGDYVSGSQSVVKRSKGKMKIYGAFSENLTMDASSKWGELFQNPTPRPVISFVENFTTIKDINLNSGGSGFGWFTYEGFTFSISNFELWLLRGTAATGNFNGNFEAEGEW